MGKRKQLFLIALLTALTVSGCWDRKEINDVGFVLATGMDIDDNGMLKGTVQVAVPAGLHTAGTGKGGGGQEPVMILHAEGPTVDRIKSKLQAQLSRRINTSHRGVMIFGEELAKHGLQNILDDMSRSPMNRLRSYIIVAKGTTAAEMMKVQVPIEAYPSEAIREMEKMELGTVGITLRDFFVASTQPGQQPVTTAFTIAGQQKNDKNKAFRANGIAMFRHLKLVGYLEGDEAIGFEAMRGKLVGTDLELTIPEGGQNTITIQIRHSTSKPEVQVKQGKPFVRYHINYDAVVTENTTQLDLMNPIYVQHLNWVAANEIKQFAEVAVKKMQQHNADCIGIGAVIYRKNPDLWATMEKDWESKQFAKLPVEIFAEANVRQIGMMGPQLQLPDAEVKK